MVYLSQSLVGFGFSTQLFKVFVVVSIILLDIFWMIALTTDSMATKNMLISSWLWELLTLLDLEELGVSNCDC